MRLPRFLLGVCLGATLGVLLLIGGGMFDNPFTPAPKCPGCAVLTHPYGGCGDQVQGGWICP
ncbi:MAG TPA: hypothetical protein VG815_14965 [Chloroflexota bacterium]|nr:hypothetical protein [Chloroflexota bacterium]HEV3370479.1 hypothetical protein [Acidimicrobiales bacterium]